MPEYNANGYDDLRQYIYDNYNWLAILNDGGAEMFRWDLLSNGNVTVSSGPASNPIEYTITVSGQDLQNEGNSLPQTIETQEIYKTSGSSTAFGSDQVRDSTGTARTATLESPDDELTMTFKQEVPTQ